MAIEQVVLLAGGRGSRLSALYPDIAKAAVRVAGEPFVCRLLRRLSAAGLKRALLLVGHLSETVERAVGDARALGVDVQFVSDGERFRGTGGALRSAVDALDEEFVVTNADTYPLYDVRSVLVCMNACEAPAVATVVPARAGFRPNLTLLGGIVSRYEKRGFDSATHVEAGFVKLTRHYVAELLPAERISSLEDEIYAVLGERGMMGAVEAAEGFIDIGTLAGLREFERWLGSTEARPRSPDTGVARVR